MALPKIKYPIYEIELPSNKRTIRYRPFLVREEKIMILANESNDPTQVVLAVKQVLTNCILSKDVNPEDLATFDLEYLFLNMYRRSIDDEFDMTIICPDDETTEQKVRLRVDDIKIQFNENHKKEIEIDDGIVITMRYPTFKQFVENNFDYSSLNEDGVDESNVNKVNDTFTLLNSCIDTVTTPDGETTSISDCTEVETNEFVEGLTQKTFEKINEFFDTMPKLRHEIKVKNPNTKKTSTVVLEGLNDFFG